MRMRMRLVRLESREVWTSRAVKRGTGGRTGREHPVVVYHLLVDRRWRAGTYRELLGSGGRLGFTSGFVFRRGRAGSRG